MNMNMRAGLTRIVMTGGFLALLAGFGLSGYAGPNPTQTPARVPASPAATPVSPAPSPSAQRHNHRPGGTRIDLHPGLTRACRALKAAAKLLKRSTSDYGGHRAAALQHIEKAQAELEAALQFDGGN